MQSVATLHVSPLVDLSPHLLVTVLQVMPPVQSELLLQVLRQVGLEGLHSYEPHEDVVAAGHPPLPSQLAE